MEKNTKILICSENDDERAKIIDGISKSMRSRCDEVKDGESALAMIINNTYDVVVLDLWISRLDGIGVIRHFKKLALLQVPFF